MSSELRALLPQLITQTGPLGLLCVLVLLELRDQGSTLELMREHLAVCIATAGG
jgi:hypothetical protein